MSSKNNALMPVSMSAHPSSVRLQISFFRFEWNSLFSQRSMGKRQRPKVKVKVLRKLH